MTQKNEWIGQVAASTDPDQIHACKKDAEMNKATDNTMRTFEKAVEPLIALSAAANELSLSSLDETEKEFFAICEKYGLDDDLVDNGAQIGSEVKLDEIRRTKAAIEAFREIDLGKAESEEIMGVADRFNLTVDQLVKSLCMDLFNRFADIRLQHQQTLDNRKSLMARCKSAGRSQADAEILFSPLPWTREHLIQMTDRVVDHFIDKLSTGVESTESMMDIVAEATASARDGFIERVIELSATSFPEVRA